MRISSSRKTQAPSGGAKKSSREEKDNFLFWQDFLNLALNQAETYLHSTNQSLDGGAFADS